MPAPRISRAPRSSRRSTPRRRSRATPPRTTAPACPTRELARAQTARPRSVPPLAALHRGGGRPREALRGARRSRCRRRSATPRARRYRRSRRSSCSPTASASSGGFAGSRHWLSCAVIAEDKGLMQRDDWYSASRVPAKIAEPRALGRYAGSRARGAPGRAQDRHLPGAGAVRGAGGDRPDRALRLGGERRQPVPQDLVPGRQPGQAGVLAAGVASTSGRSSRRAWRAARSTRKAWRRAARRSCATAWWRAISSAATRRASSA